jgi:pimeloyl-ACP methyl ester carboxylesterase
VDPLIILLCLLAQQPATPAPAAAPADPVLAGARRVEVNGTELTYIERGQGGTPVVFVHGSGADLRTWGYQVQYFGATRRAIAYSRRYHHPNAWIGDGRDYGPALHAADLAAFIQSVAGGPVDVVAASYGGVVALLMARDHPALVRRLVLVEPVVFSLLPADAPEAAATQRLDLAREQLLAGDTDAALRTYISTIIGPGVYELMAPSARQMLHDNLPELQAEARVPTVSLAPLYTCDDARRVRTPVLLVTGGLSAPFLKAIAAHVAACLPHVETMTIAGAAHAVHAQQGVAFDEAVTRFLAAAPSPP